MMKIRIISFTSRGKALARRISSRPLSIRTSSRVIGSPLTDARTESTRVSLPISWAASGSVWSRKAKIQRADSFFIIPYFSPDRVFCNLIFYLINPKFQ